MLNDREASVGSCGSTAVELQPETPCPTILSIKDSQQTQKQCKVCGDTALNMNFGAVSCESCKAFFRRNALRNKEFKCPFQNECQIDIESRRWCQQCRLRKCVEVGMKKQLIQKAKRTVDEPSPDSTEDSRAVASLEQSQSLISPELTWSKSQSVPVPKRKRTNRNTVISSCTSSTEVIKSRGTLKMSVREIVCSPAPSSESCSTGDCDGEFHGLNLEILSTFEKEKIMELVKANELMYETSAEDEVTSMQGRHQENHRLLDVANMTDIAIRRLIKMAKRMNEFKNLLQEDQIALLKGACFEMMILRGVTHYNVEKDCWRGPQAMMIKVDVLKEARGNCYEEIRTFIHSFALELRKDEPLLLILGAIALFNPDRPQVEHRGRIRAQQSLYFFLLHSYLRARYPSHTAEETESLYQEMAMKVQQVQLLNERHITMFLDLDPAQVEPLLIEIFDLKLTLPAQI